MDNGQWTITEVTFPEVWPYDQTIEEIFLTKFWEN